MRRYAVIFLLLVPFALVTPVLLAGPASADSFSGTVTAPVDAFVEGSLFLAAEGAAEQGGGVNLSFGDSRVLTADVPPGDYEGRLTAMVFGPGNSSTGVYASNLAFDLWEPDDVIDVVLPVVPLEVHLVDTGGAAVDRDLKLSCGERIDRGVGEPEPWNARSSGSTVAGETVLQAVDSGAATSASECTVEIDMGGGLPSLTRVVDATAGSTTITIPDRRVEVSGTLDWPFLPLSDGGVQVTLPGGSSVGWAPMSATGDWSLEVWPGTYDFRWYARDEAENAELVQRNIEVEGDTVLDTGLEYRPVSVYAVDGSGQTIFGYAQASCRNDLSGLGSTMSINRVPKPGAPVDFGGLVSTTGWECWLTGHDGYDHWAHVDWFTVPASADDIWTWDTTTGELTQGAPTTDGDAVADEVEGQAPNGGDGNNDGTADNEQANVTSLPANNATPGDGAPYVTVAGPAGTTLSGVTTVDPATLTSQPPAGTVLPAGLVSFRLNVAEPGETRTVSIYAGSTAGVTEYAKYDPGTEAWSRLPDERVTVLADHVDISLTDGGIGDADGLPNGVITDPGGMVRSSQADTSAPTVTGHATSRPNANGWYRGDVRIKWTATDPGSGVDAQPADTVVTGEGDNLTAESPQVCDQAPTPNCATGSVSGLKIDRTAPSLTVGGVTHGATYQLGSVPTPRCDASDTVSGLAKPCSGLRVGGNRNGVGEFTFAATAVDRAGNRRVVSATYRVVYRVDGFLAPLNNPPAATSVFRSGSRIPVAISVRRANGQMVTPVTRPVWVAPVRGARTSLPVNESASSGSGTPGSSFVSRNNRWEYLWSTRDVAAGYLYRIGVRLDDGTTRYLTVGLR